MFSNMRSNSFATSVAMVKAAKGPANSGSAPQAPASKEKKKNNGECVCCSQPQGLEECSRLKKKKKVTGQN